MHVGIRRTFPVLVMAALGYLCLQGVLGYNLWHICEQVETSATIKEQEFPVQGNQRPRGMTHLGLFLWKHNIFNG